MNTTTAQVDDDPAVEVFTAGTASIRASGGRTGEREWQRDLTNARIRAAADADGDGTVEPYAGRVGGTVLAPDARSGRTEWSTTVSGNDGTIVPPPVLGDLDGDGRPEVTGVVNDGTVAVLDPETGVELALSERTAPVWTFPTVLDIDGGGAEILVRYGDGRVVALEDVDDDDTTAPESFDGWSGSRSTGVSGRSFGVGSELAPERVAERSSPSRFVRSFP